VQGASQPANPAPQSGSSQEFVAPRAWDPGERPPEKEGCARPSVGVGVNADLALRRGAPALSGCRSGEAPRQGRSFLKKFFWMAMRIPIFQFPRHVITDLLIEGGSLLLHRVSVSILAAAILRDLFGADEEGQPDALAAVLLRDGHEIDVGSRKDSRSDQAPERSVGEEVERNGIVLRVVLAGFAGERARLLFVSAQREIDGRLS
jgi:hypothetical protein